MAAVIMEKYNDFMGFMFDNRDRRVDGWLMMGSPWPGLLICLFYVWLVEYGLPMWMKNRKPYELRNVMLIYNFGMVALSGYIFMELGLSGWFTGYSFGCDTVDYSNSPRALRMARACWWFFFSKYIELADTVIFCLRKKFNQVTFLHVFHHGIMPFSWWFGVRFVPGGFGTFHALLNSLIHFLMYIYYGLAGLGPQYQKYLWWKRYMTSMQITQFLLVTIHSIQLFFLKDCQYPIMFAYWILSYAVIFLVMFADFYRKAYNKPSKKGAHKRDQTSLVNGLNEKESAKKE